MTITITSPREEALEALLKLAKELGMEVSVQPSSINAASAEHPATDIGTRFNWDKSLARTKDIGGKPASEICIEDRENDWR